MEPLLRELRKTNERRKVREPKPCRTMEVMECGISNAYAAWRIADQELSIMNYST